METGDRPTRSLRDSDGDGTIDAADHWIYDEAGQLTEHILDSNGDQIADYRTIHTR